MSSDQEQPNLPQKAKRKQAVRWRDRERCTNCRRPAKVVDTLDVDHCVPRGSGGSELMSNNSTLCRRCHEAKHEDGLAPTVEIQSTGMMTQYEFDLFRHFIREMLPALARQVDVAIKPRYNLDNRGVWHLPMGDVKILNKVLCDDSEYGSFDLADYM